MSRRFFMIIYTMIIYKVHDTIVGLGYNLQKIQDNMEA